MPVKRLKPLYSEVETMKKWSIAGILILSLMAICLGAIVAFVPALGQLWSGNVQWNFWPNRGFSADLLEEQTAAVDGPADLTVNTPFGNVDVQAQPSSNEISISAHKYAWGTSRQAAEDLLEKVKIIVGQNGNSVDVRVDQPVEVNIFHIGPAGISVDFTILVPTDCTVNASSASGDIHLKGTSGAAVLHSNFGKVAAEKVRGGMRAGSESGKVAVYDIAAGEESVEATSSFGDVLVSNAEGSDLLVKSSSGKILVEDSSFTGRAEISTSFGDIDVSGLKARSLNARTNSGTVELGGAQVADDLTAHSDFGDVEVDNSPAGSYDLSTNSGKVTARDTRGAVKARSGFGDIEIEGTGAVLDLSTSSGQIEFSGSLGDGASVLHSNFGDIRILLPGDAEFELDLSTNFGDVSCGFEVAVTREGSTHLTGTVGAGGPRLKASTNSGNIHVEPGASE
jgi:DUF4097 and DUF4098 domain-containing protein YvlB